MFNSFKVAIWCGLLIQLKSGGFVQLFSQPKQQNYPMDKQILYFILLLHVLLIQGFPTFVANVPFAIKLLTEIYSNKHLVGNQ